jgi:glycosyltransferase involved in cell wall biosynthesis
VNKKKILFVTDTNNWAWYIKAKYLEKYLSDEFDIDVVSTIGEGSVRSIDTKKYDLYFTFGYSYIDMLYDVPKHKKISGVTAHRNWKNLDIEKRFKDVGTIFAVSKLLYEEIKEFHPKVYYLPNGVDETLFIEEKPIPKIRDNLIVGHVGKLFLPKNQLSIIEPACKAANVWYMHHYNNYENAIPHKEMVGFYQNIDVFICASDEDGTPNPLLEALSCGRPFISNNIGNIPELLKDGECGILIEKNIYAYVEKLLWLKDNREEIIKMGKEGRKVIEKGWTWKIQSEKYRKMFRELLH